jgi:hypothetical protein
VGISIYYQARRERPLSTGEWEAIEELVDRHDVGTRVSEAGQEVEGPGWASFCIYPHDEHTEPGVIFEGGAGLPLTDEDEFWAAIQHWCRVLTLIRRAVPGATWSAHIDDLAVAWDEPRNEYDPSTEAGSA